MKYCLIEDSVRNRFAPFTILRTVDTLFMGSENIYVKWKKELGVETLERFAPQELHAVWSSDQASEADLFINPRVLPSKDLVKKINTLNVGERLLGEKNTVIAIRPQQKLTSFKPIDEIQFNKEFHIELNEKQILHEVWELMTGNGNEIQNDWNRFEYKDNRNDLNLKKVIIEGDHPVFIHPTAKIEPGVTILSYDGPVIIKESAHIMTGTMIRGPVSIGDFAVLKMGGHIYGETSIGSHCRVGGEVKNAIFHPYSNKAHGGYIGNAIVGEWCNWGAHTNCSNLKNNYSEVKIATFPDGKMKATGSQFVGVMMGDHTKTAINTSINTGSVFGVMCTIATDGFPPKFLPNFSWLYNGVIEKYHVDKAVETIRHIMSRRNVVLSNAEISLYKTIFENS
jgi:UDP-N-acetylglucosamine diphosphorylase/glucosamine-1-phosphate N-acetyltransferase